jgi:hypothetical protein
LLLPWFYGYAILVLLSASGIGFWFVASPHSNKRRKDFQGIGYSLYRYENTSSLSHRKIAIGIEQTLYLIREELKSRNFFNGLQQVGLGDCHFQLHLDSLILRFFGIDGSDENFTQYMDIMEKRSKKIEPDQQSITKQALKAYNELMEVKRRIKEGERKEI